MITIYNDDIYEFIQKNEEYLKIQLKDNDEKISDENIEKAAEFLIDDDAMILRDYIKIFDEYAKYNKIIVIADLGLWYGRRKASKKFDSLFHAFYACIEDNNHVYFKNKNATLQLSATHHDGCNNFKFYKIINNKKYAIKIDELTKY